MAPKKWWTFVRTHILPVTALLFPQSSSEEEKCGSSGEVSESSKKPESDSVFPQSSSEEEKCGSSGEVSESSKKPESDSEPAQTMELTPVVTKPIPDKSGSAATVPESSTAKRPLKKQKTSNDEVTGDDAKKLFQRLFSEADEIALLQGIIDFKGDPSDIDAFCLYVKDLIDFKATNNQIVTKLQRLKSRFKNTVSEDEIQFDKDIEKKRFELSRKIWGNNGVLTSKSSKKKHGGIPAPKEMKKPEKSETKVVNTSLSIGREIASFFIAGNASSCGLDESTITAGWAKVADGAEKREVEEKWKKLKDKEYELCLQRSELLNKLKGKEFELCLQRSGLVNETARMILKAL